MVDTFGTGKVADLVLADAVNSVFDFTPAGIIQTLDLRRPIYKALASYGHFGRGGLTWEKTDRIEALKDAVK
jgi:S-adenosylmethionine synthetase